MLQQGICPPQLFLDFMPISLFAKALQQQIIRSSSSVCVQAVVEVPGETTRVHGSVLLLCASVSLDSLT